MTWQQLEGLQPSGSERANPGIVLHQSQGPSFSTQQHQGQLVPKAVHVLNKHRKLVNALVNDQLKSKACGHELPCSSRDKSCRARSTLFPHYPWLCKPATRRHIHCMVESTNDRPGGGGQGPAAILKRKLEATRESGRSTCGTDCWRLTRCCQCRSAPLSASGYSPAIPTLRASTRMLRRAGAMPCVLCPLLRRLENWAKIKVRGGLIGP